MMNIIYNKKFMLHTYQFHDIEPVPRNISCFAVEDVVCLQRGKHPEKETRNPYQNCILETW
jgi:hypothetical protein